MSYERNTAALSLRGLGQNTETLDPALLGGDRYIPPRNIDPTTGRPVPTADRPVPWGVAEVGLRDIKCRFYHNAPRELVVSQSLPYTMEITAGDDTFIGSCQPRTECPAAVHQGASIKDPWRQRVCRAWREQWERDAANIIADPEFRANVSERVLDVAGITGLARYRAKPAEFLEVVGEREARETPIKLFAFLALAGGGALLTFLQVRKWAKRRRQARAELG